jgi:hypothetical protein
MDNKNIYSKRLIFFDTEFTDFINTDLISIGLITEDGKHEFYCELTDYNSKACSEFVRNVVLPLLDNSKFGMKRSEASARLFCWLEELGDEFILCPDYIGDWDCIADLLEVFPPNIDSKPLMYHQFVNTLIIAKADELQTPDLKWFFEMAKKKCAEGFLEYFLRNPNPKQHHALADAKANRAAYFATLQWLGSHGY